MDSAAHAASQIETIRALLERATIYRAISVPGAALGGGLALVAAWFTHRLSAPSWLAVWLGVLLLASAFNFFHLVREARREGRPLFSHRFQLALRGLGPALLAGGVIGLAFGWHGALEMTASLWAVFYGLALLALREFAPPSLARLGFAFLAAGLIGFVTIAFWAPGAAGDCPATMASTLMAATFGIFHLAYAAAVRRRRP